MKKLILLLILCSLFVKPFAQSIGDYQQAMTKGDKEFNKGEYKKAINFYFAAAAFMPENKGEVKEKVKKVFDEIESLRKQAADALAESVKQTNLALEAKREAEKEKQNALNNAEEAKISNKKLHEFLSTVIGAKYKGGKIAWKDSTGKHGLIAADIDIPGQYTWDSAIVVCNNYIVTQGDSTYRSWHLPTKDELNKLYVNKDVIGGFSNAIYWSSSEEFPEDDKAWFQSFGGGFQNANIKGLTRLVRAVKAF